MTEGGDEEGIPLHLLNEDYALALYLQVDKRTLFSLDFWFVARQRGSIWYYVQKKSAKFALDFSRNLRVAWT